MSNEIENSNILNVKIKKEKLDSEIDEKIKLSELGKKVEDIKPNIQELIKNIDDEKSEKKPIIEPLKSSNEILAELFKVFNATPPEELLNDESLLKKKSKHKKHKKEKRKKRKKAEAQEKTYKNDSESSETDSHKSKRKRRTHKRNSEKKCKKFEILTRNHHKRRHSVDDETSTKPIKRSRTIPACSEEKVNSFYKGFIETTTNKDKVKSEPKHEEKIVSTKDDEDNISEISLSDEETYLKEKEREEIQYRSSCTEPISTKNKDSDRSDYISRRNTNHKSYNNFYKGINEYTKDHSRNHGNHRRTRSRSRPRSRSSPRDLGIDKKRLLEIARKNAISMFKRGSLPGCAGMSEEVKDKVLMKMRYGGKTVQDLTEFCRKLSNGGNFNELSEFSSDEDSDIDKNGNTKAFHHPFILKDREPIVMHIRNAVPIPPKTAEQAKSITMQFPVSSGQQHRLTEGWVPVSQPLPNQPCTALQILQPATNNIGKILVTDKASEKNIFQRQLPTEEQEPAFIATTLTPNETMLTPKATAQPDDKINTMKTMDLKALPSTHNNIVPVATVAPVAAQPRQPSSVNIFATPSPPVDVSTIISKRLNAMRRLQENPMDSEALKMMYSSQQEMTSWASSKYTPGQFTGSTGANILSPKELTGGVQAWAHKNELICTQPVTGGMGMHLLKKMGWKPGEGLGREKTGSLQPLLLDVKLDKRGLESNEDHNTHSGDNYQRPIAPMKRKKCTPIPQRTIEDKHPVCLLNEIAAKRKWIPPLYTLVTDSGPSHSKNFVFSVSFNGQTFVTETGANTKKEAKMVAAKNCLQQIGILPISGTTI